MARTLKDREVFIKSLFLAETETQQKLLIFIWRAKAGTCNNVLRKFFLDSDRHRPRLLSLFVSRLRIKVPECVAITPPSSQRHRNIAISG